MELGQEWRPRTLREAEREHIVATLVFAKGNQREAARRLGISRWALDRRIRRMGIKGEELGNART